MIEIERSFVSNIKKRGGKNTQDQHNFHIKTYCKRDMLIYIGLMTYISAMSKIIIILLNALYYFAIQLHYSWYTTHTHFSYALAAICD